ncbi:dihydrofolate reductase [Leifsonia flava]|uniref:Dihydrofolate reductase n=1 Tax=Orlajensenia leifsoniae TaxID=2561933 RepID=A0A4Y9R224_9MICO|nr:dihydrofolate reductase [Leifsonia flava]TFV98751.1 dihydrofolate reductase [Leifsonia flava]
MTDAASVPLGLIWAQSSDGTIGRDGVMPWHLPEDLAHFKQVTLGAPVVMGRKTWDSLPPRFRPLAGRRNIVLTRQRDWSADGAGVAHSIEAAIALAAEPVSATDAAPERIWIIGGAELFAALIDQADVLEVTEIDASFPGDTEAPLIGAAWSAAITDPAESEPLRWHTSRTGLQYRFLTYTRG